MIKRTTNLIFLNYREYLFLNLFMVSKDMQKILAITIVLLLILLSVLVAFLPYFYAKSEP